MTTPREYPWRAQAGIAIVLLMSAFAVCTLAAYCSLIGRDSGDHPGEIVMDEARFKGLRAMLPSRGTVGYLSDIGGSLQSPKPYYLTQYFLAPVVVAPDTAHQLVVANFLSSSSIAALAAAHDLIVVRDFSNGVALLRRPRL